MRLELQWAIIALGLIALPGGMARAEDLTERGEAAASPSIDATATARSDVRADRQADTQTDAQTDAQADADSTADADSSSSADSSADATGSPAAPLAQVERAPSEKIEEIKITGRRRSETVQQAPVSVTTFGDVEIESLEIRDLQDLQRFVPNLQFDESAASQNSARIFFRGIGNDDPIITDEGGVGITVDDVFLPRAAGVLLSLSDVERVEVLAGPQATLYGKNTVAGLIRYLTKRPEWDFSGRASLRVGNFDRLETELMLNVPLLPERLAMRMNLGTDYNEGFVKNRGPGRDRSLQTRSLKGQVQLLLQATEDLDVLVKGYATRSPNSGSSAKCDLRLGLDPNSLDGRLFGTNAGPGLRGNFAEECIRDEERGFEKVSSDAAQRGELDTMGASLHLTYSPSDAFAFRSITAWNRNETDTSFDGDATPLPISQEVAGDKNESTQDAISQEFNLSGAAMNGRFNWVTGVFGLVEKNQDDERQTSTPATFMDPIELRFGDLANARVLGVTPLASFAPPGTFSEGGVGLQAIQPGLLTATALGPNILLPGAPLAPDEVPLRLTNGAGDCVASTEQTLRITADLGAGTPVPLTIPSCRRQFTGIQTAGFLKSNVTSYAAYGQFGFELTDTLTFEAGVRFTHERKRVARTVRVLPGSIPLVREPSTIARNFFVSDFEFSRRFGRFSPSASLRYEPTKDLNFYVLWGRGFKSGGFNGRGVGDDDEVISYDPELVTTYEFGVKSRWFERRLTVNGALFSTGYDDIQLVNIQINQSSGRIIVVTDNVGKARINGAELSVVALPLDNLVVRASGGITAGRYNKVEPSRTGFLQLVGPNARLTGAPTYTGSVSVSYDMPLGRLGDLSSTFSWSYRGSKSNNPQNSEFSNKVGLLSGRIGLDLPDGKTRIALFGSNLLDREYVANSLDIVRQTLQFFGPPRQVGVEITRSF